jgi:RimJ/RimL family protein N-acetyltransferase
MRLHARALFRCDGAGRLVAVNDQAGAVAPRFFLGLTENGNLWWFRNDISAALASELDALSESLSPGLEEANVDIGAVIARLSRDQPIRKIWAGPAFRFPSDVPAQHDAVRVTPENAALLSPYLEDWQSDVAAGVPMAVLLEKGKAVSVCCSVRMTKDAHEAGVETHPEFRGRGYGGQAVCAWANAVRKLDRIPLYSTSWENSASRKLARKIGLIQFGADLHIT